MRPPPLSLALVPVLLLAGGGGLLSPELSGQLVELFGRVHPMLVHFPVALLLVAVLVELLRGRRQGPQPSDTALLLVTLGALGAGISAWSGWTWAAHEDFGRSVARLLFFHRWTGVGLAGLAGLTALLAWIARWSGASLAAGSYRALLLLTGILVVVVGHLGGTLVHGDVTDVFETHHAVPAPIASPPAASAPAASAPAASAPAETPSESPPGDQPAAAATEPEPEPSVPPQTSLARTGDPTAASLAPHAPSTLDPAMPGVPAGPVSPGALPRDPEAPGPPADPVAPRSGGVDFVRDVEPIFEARCVECHGPKKHKGGMRLEPIQEAFEGPPEDLPIVPGNALASPLYKRISLPDEDPDRMPSKGERLTPAQIDTIRAWIQAGAHHPGEKAANAGKTPDGE